MSLVDRYARWSYENFRLCQPQIDTKGLFQSGATFKIVVPNYKLLKADDGTSLEEWFHGHKALTSPVVLADATTEGDIPVPQRSLDEISNLAGWPRTINDVIGELNMQLGQKFPRFVIGDFPPHKGFVKVERSLSAEEEKRLMSILEDLQIPLKWEVEVAQLPELKTNVPNPLGLALTTSRDLQFKDASSTLRRLMEKDEDSWVTDGRKILSGVPIESTSLADFHSQLRKSESSLINASVFRPDDIRNQITLFEVVNVVMPIIGSEADALGGFGVSESEFIELIAMGRVRILLAQGVHRYSRNLIEKIADTRADAIILPRALSATLAANTRKQFPYLFPTGTIEERAEYLKLLLEVQSRLPVGFLRNPIDALITFHKKNWSTLEYTFNARGPMAVNTHGPGMYVSELFTSLLGQDQFLEFSHSELGVNLSSTLRSTYFPTEGNTWSDQAHSALLAQFYHGGMGTFIGDTQKRMNTVLDGVLAVRKEVPVIELATVVGQGDIARLKRHVFELAYKQALSLDELQEAVQLLNKEITAIESKKDRLSELDILGAVVGYLTAKATDEPLAAAVVPVAAKLMAQTINDLKPKYPLLGATADSIQSIWHKTTPDRILFARVRAQLKK